MRGIGNVFVTGARGAGKTRLLRDFLDGRGLFVSGFCTAPLVIEGVAAGHYIKGLSPLIKPEDSIRPIDAKAPRGAGCLAIPGVFDAFGSMYLSMALLDGADVILMDELGSLERDSFDFIREVTRCLDSDIPVVGALKLADERWLNAIRSRDDVAVIEVTDESRARAGDEFRLAAKGLFPDIAGGKRRILTLDGE